MLLSNLSRSVLCSSLKSHTNPSVYPLIGKFFQLAYLPILPSFTMFLELNYQAIRGRASRKLPTLADDSDGRLSENDERQNTICLDGSSIGV